MCSLNRIQFCRHPQSWPLEMKNSQRWTQLNQTVVCNQCSVQTNRAVPSCSPNSHWSAANLMPRNKYCPAKRRRSRQPTRARRPSTSRRLTFQCQSRELLRLFRPKPNSYRFSLTKTSMKPTPKRLRQMLRKFSMSFQLRLFSQQPRWLRSNPQEKLLARCTRNVLLNTRRILRSNLVFLIPSS